LTDLSDPGATGASFADAGPGARQKNDWCRPARRNYKETGAAPMPPRRGHVARREWKGNLA
jgi:hypothetical protein